LADERVAGWLAGIGLSQYAALFEENRIGLDVLPHLTDQDLKDLGLPLGDRRRVLAAAAAANSTPARVESPPLARPATSTDGERRQLTVLFCDLVGYTELASRLDPEVLQGILRRYEDVCAAGVTRYEGYVFQRLGDGIVAFFGYPLAHEGEAERAIRAGLEIVESLGKLDVPDAGRLHVRIGIATGLVVVSSAEKGAVGETMNLASRLQAIAQPGSIVVSERVRRLAGGAFDYEDLGEQTLKGIAQPTHAYRILGVSGAASRFEAATGESLTPLVGREQELALLLERWALARNGEGQVVLLSGEPGIGKSRILSTLRKRLEAQGAQTLRLQCSPYYVNSAFWPSIDNFERALKFGREESPESKLDKLEALIVTHYGRPLADVRFVASLLSIPCEERYGSVSTTPQKHKDETLRTLVDLSEAAARKQPSVMLVEDLHWADPTTLEVMDLLINRVKAMPLLVVLTHRPEFQSRWSNHGHVTGLNLAKLTRAQSAAMVSKVAGGKALPGDLLEQILAKTDGVPLFVEELTKSILESGGLKEVGERYDYAGSAHEISIPTTLRDSLMARLDRFAPVKEVAQIGAAIGREFGYELVAAVAPMAQAQLDDGLERLIESGLAFRRGAPPDATYTFKHALVQDAAYDSLLKSRRQELHGKISRVIEERFPQVKDAEPEVLAHHLTQARLAERAVPLWLAAGQRALGRMAAQEALRHLTTGLEVNAVAPSSAERDRQELATRQMLAIAHLLRSGWATVEIPSALQPARSLALKLGDKKTLVNVLFSLWLHHSMRIQFPIAHPLVGELHALARESGESDDLVVAFSADTMTSCWTGNFARAREALRATLAAYDLTRHGALVHRQGYDNKCACLLWGGFALWVLGYPDQAREASVEAVALARELGHAWNMAWTLALGTMNFVYCGETGRAWQWLEESRAIARDQALIPMLELEHPYHFGVTLVQDGKFEAGYQQLVHASKAIRAVDWSHPIPRTNLHTAAALGALGQAEQARAIVAESLRMIEDFGFGMDEAEAHRIEGELLMQLGPAQTPRAEEAFHRALEVARSQQAKSWELRAATSLARLWQSQGRRKEAYDLLASVYGWFSEGFDTKDLKEARALLDDLR
jgi:class 3 adenylate cyclase/predicted ATPase